MATAPPKSRSWSWRSKAFRGVLYQVIVLALLVAAGSYLLSNTLANMRDHLQTLQEIQMQLGMGHPDVAAGIAEARLGLSSLELHGAADVAKYMPQGMQDAGTAMHRAASRFAIAAQDASVTGDLKPVFAGLADITAQCVGCHAGYRLK